VTLPARPREVRLPLESTAIIGRSKELAEITSLLRRTRLLTLTGPPGAGKSRLALAAARMASSSFEDGVHVADLADVASEDHLFGTLAEALWLRDRASDLSAGVLVDVIGNRQMLLVLDAYEQVLDACAELVLALVGRCARLSVLASSFRRLGVAGETLWRVPMLAPPAPTSAFDEVESNAAVQLFVARATEVEPRFQFDASNAEQVAEVCRRLDGLPLALELAAGRANVLVLPEILERLSDPLRLLERPLPRGPERHRTLRATLERATALLGDRQQRVFRRLAVFPGTWDLDAARAVCADDPTLRHDVPALLAELIAASLVQVLPTRYHLLGLIRQYALEQFVDAGEVQSARRLHAAWFRELARRVSLGEGRAAHIQCVRIEQDNLSAALAWAVEQRHAALAFDLLVPLQGLWYLQGEFNQSREWFARVASLPGGSARSRVTLATLASVQALAQGDFAAALGSADEAAAAALNVGDVAFDAQPLHVLAEIKLVQGDLERAENLFRQELELLSDRPDLEWLRLPALVRLAEFQVERGSTARAEALANQVLARLGESGNPWTRLRAIRVLGTIALDGGEAGAAEPHFQSSLALATTIGDRHATLDVLVDLARVAQRRHGLAAARRLLRDALDEAQLRRNPVAMIHVLEAVAELYARTRPRAALRLGAAAASQRAQLGVRAWPRERATAERWRGEATRRLGSATVARTVAAGGLLDEAASVGAAYDLLNSVEIRPAPGAGPTQGLTLRELEVARLVGQGFTNQAVADSLLVSLGTVRAHVDRILGKLGLQSRTEIAEWLT
jgi:non-specific serine/threonine protein kinase